MSRKGSPLVVYDIERRLSSSSPTPSDLSAILSKKKHWTHRFRATLYGAMDFPRPVHLGLTCLSIAASASQANGVYCWGTYGPVVARMMKLDGTEAQTIVVGGIVGVYVMAAPLGSLTDTYGPRIGSLVSACLGAIGYMSFSTILAKASPETPYLYLWLTAAYFLVGAATVGSYFACLTCASLSFPNYPTLSLSLPLSLIGLSSLILSSFSSLPYFASATTQDLNPVKFLFFLGVLSPAINLWGSIFMRIVPLPPSDLDTDQEDEAEPANSLSQRFHLDEHTPLLIGGPEQALEEIEGLESQGMPEKQWGVRDLLLDYKGFWLFGVLCALTVGPGEMIMASIGSILTSLLPSSTSLLHLVQHSSLVLRNKHVFLISLSSTLSRLLTGVLADYLCPSPTAFINPRYKQDPSQPSHILKQVRKVKLTRSAFTAICSAILAAVFVWSSGYLTREPKLVLTSIGAGSMYGALFTLTPAIVSHHFGPTNFGLAWGMISYFAALGSVVYSYLYALLSDPGEETECHGTHCFRTTFIVCAVSCTIGSVGLWLLGRRWKV
ncbi:uncharacterized protein L203_102769 [Cryptococcus depauperatus CBS 7841]|uniref:Nodulin-like domain-containing protein n=1 Tax=Cryptococcus depauperatus CBS 7841 TaxID=1295531 RepID=A0A1E3IB62_9TREE|nr:hypothetical protein L203_04572 [Cryptococcus depauperatus CBS 7841]